MGAGWWGQGPIVFLPEVGCPSRSMPLGVLVSQAVTRTQLLRPHLLHRFVLHLAVVLLKACVWCRPQLTRGRLRQPLSDHLDDD